MSKAEEIEEKIKEKRILEANQKGLMGQNGKIAIVLKVLGEQIIKQSEGGYYVDSNYLDLEGNNNLEKSIHDLDNPIDLLKQIPIMGIEETNRPEGKDWTEISDIRYYGTDTIGMHFDGLNRGMHMEIKYDDIISELVVTYKGYTVYKENKGELLSYNPIDEWEKWIESLYKIAKEKQRKTKEKEFEESIKNNEKEKQIWWEKIKNRWGIK